ncbi:MAG: flagellin lysine-N-methylase [Clostridia bacterium]|nr:flagellin lysine-N-methylase [Clostridia bacterium]
MKILAPNYYKSFKCIADKCGHSCCIGWDVYIDEETLERYESAEGCLGARIRESLCEKEDGVCFEMRADGRCPFLNDTGLCDIICERGEGYISEICREHPRYYNFFADRTEMGIGLSCEEAARIILSQTEKTVLVTVCEDEWEPDEPSAWENTLQTEREKLFNKIQNEPINFDVLKNAGKTPSEWREILRSLERLDSLWDDYLDLITDEDADLTHLELPLQKLLLYFAYRHTANAEDIAELLARISFAYLSCLVVRSVCIGKMKKDGKCELADLCEFARAYSAEVEYSEENTEELIDIFR